MTQPFAAGRTARYIVAALVVVAGLTLEARTLFVSSPPIEAHGTKPWTVDQFGAGQPVGETFRPEANGLDETRLQFASNVPARVDVQCWLLTWTGIQPDPWGPLYAWRTTLELPAGTSWQRFEFEPVERSERVIYLFRVQLAGYASLRPSDQGPSIRLIGSEDNSLKDGNAIAGGAQMVERDLMFEAHFDDSAFARFHRETLAYLPKALRRTAAQLAILALYNAAFAAFVAAALIGDRPEPRT